MDMTEFEELTEADALIWWEVGHRFDGNQPTPGGALFQASFDGDRQADELMRWAQGWRTMARELQLDLRRLFRIRNSHGVEIFCGGALP
jgi:hypothetical protein